jgi:hypothetical protein
MDNFTRGYIVCALWSSTDNSNDQGGDPLDDNYSLDDLAPATLETIKADCADFQMSNKGLLTQAYKLYPLSGEQHAPEEQAGHDFWLTRNGHGAGFWDRGIGIVGEKLTVSSKVYGSVDLYVGDDGLIYS